MVDLCCGPGGAGMGYHLAGFEMVGVDIEPQPSYPFEFHQGDALTYPLDGFDAVHVSPPCQHYANVTAWGHSHMRPRDDYPDLIGPIRERLMETGLPYVIENVRTTALRQPTMLCGSAFGLRVIRHRYFETGGGLALPVLTPVCRHIGIIPFDHGGKYSESEFRTAMGCDWMGAHEARQAIPPAFTDWIGRHLMAALGKAAA
jgi:DNA (cytosine-5)-methyltransferase 1